MLPSLGVDRAEDVVEQGPLLETRRTRIRIECEQRARQLEHVVDVARFGRAAVDAIVQLVGFAEVLVFAVSARGKAVMVGDALPEKPGRGQVALVARVGVAIERADELRHLRVAVLAGQIVFALA